MSSLEDRCWSCTCASNVETKHSSGASCLASKVEEMMSSITSVLCNAYGSLHSVRAANLIRRGLVLFTVGASLALVLNLLQIQRNVTLFPEEVMTTLFSSAWWIPPCCGTGAGEESTSHSIISELSVVVERLTSVISSLFLSWGQRNAGVGYRTFYFLIRQNIVASNYKFLKSLGSMPIVYTH